MKKILTMVLCGLLLFLAGCEGMNAPVYTENPAPAPTAGDETPLPRETDTPASQATSAPDTTAAPEETVLPEETIEPVIIRDISAFFGGADGDAAMEALSPLLEAVAMTTYTRVLGNEADPADITRDTYVLEALYRYMGARGEALRDAKVEGNSVTLPLSRANELVSAMFLGREGLPDIPGEWASLLAYDGEAQTLTACDYVPAQLEMILTGTAYDTEAEQLLATVELRWPQAEEAAMSFIITLLREEGSDTGAMVSMVDIG